MIARRIPVRAPSNASLIERLLKDGLPFPPNRNPVYAMATVQETARTFMEVSSGVDGSDSTLWAVTEPGMAKITGRNCHSPPGSSLIW